ncbi:hypothetical protein [Bernardetia sp.]|uniref:hypothetical protein n=1 Tax=Bernardetia sp. TaxID=1937974 RepID=UPI0025BF3365|nr:hypothetical protein [Bernardetia sp.]
MFKQKLSLQEYLSLGYLYLVILGIISEVIYFKILGVDILNYASISDILLSPLGIMASKPILFIIFFVIISAAFIFVAFVIPKLHQQFRDKKWYNKINDVEKSDEAHKKIRKEGAIPFILFMILSMFLGMGIGRGDTVKKRLQTNNFEPDCRIVLSDGISKDIYVIGQNSMYLFYVEKGQQEITISAINPNIKSITNMPKP